MKNKIIKFVFGVVFTLSLVLAFQNCNKIKVVDERDRSLASTQSDITSYNNGGAYEGKGEKFYRFATGFTCQGNLAPIGLVSLGGSTDYLQLNSRNQCNSLNEALNLPDVDRSPHQSAVIGYKEGIYEFQSAIPVNIPDRIVEFWCRDPLSRDVPEVVVHYDSSNMQTLVKVYHFSSINPGNSISLPEFTVDYNLVLGTKHQMINDNVGFRMFVWSDQPSVVYAGQYEASMEAILEGRYATHFLTCRVGGRYDPLR